ncbi:enoyl-CoA delta isomerase 2-like [Bactrocera dorsalis]|uniref:Enoyl-CoA delta isomerase 2-like n=1 Tax=Bactrocera dorsalis TaxID=27457 RepID=A0ABM3JTQ1_BACDO|nr:enoyl-CoA delta isomerase 2-like [Bactrocera dorsalis]
MSATKNGIGIEINAQRTATSATTTTAVTPTKRLPGDYGELDVEQRGPICVITFKRSAVRNALTRRGYYELIRALADATFSETITTVVLTGAAGNFSAGNDLTQLRQYADPQAFLRCSEYVLSLLIKAFIYCPKVLVALVDGACIGIGFVIAALCDVVYCTERAYFQAPFTQYGICPEGCLTYLLPQLLGRVKAAELLLFGTRLSADEALCYNFVARIIQATDIEQQFWPQLEQYARLPLESLRATKRLLSEAERTQLLNALKAECGELKSLRLGATYQRAIEAFVNRKGREGGVLSKNKL